MNQNISVCIGTKHFFYCISVLWCSSGLHFGSDSLYVIYILPLGLIFKKYGISFHVYADDIQLYLSFKPNGVNSLGDLYACIQELKIWLTETFLMLN